MRKTRLAVVIIIAFLSLCAFQAGAQGTDAYIQDMEQAMHPFGLIEAHTCHNVTIHPANRLGLLWIPSGVNSQGETTYSAFAIDAVRINLDLSALNEDKIMTDTMISSSYFDNHKLGAPMVPDTPIVLIPSISPRHQITVYAVDFDKLKDLQQKTQVTEDTLISKVEQRMAVIVPFSNKDQAEAFKNALQKAIVVCKAQ
jgi:hypothetical protein